MISSRVSLFPVVIVLSFAPLFGMKTVGHTVKPTESAVKFGMSQCASVASGMSGLCPSVTSDSRPSTPAMTVVDEKVAVSKAKDVSMSEADKELAQTLSESWSFLRGIINDSEWSEIIKNPQWAENKLLVKMAKLIEGYIAKAMEDVKRARDSEHLLHHWLADCVAKNVAYIQVYLPKDQKTKELAESQDEELLATVIDLDVEPVVARCQEQEVQAS